jgi:hypothetical protein
MKFARLCMNTKVSCLIPFPKKAKFSAGSVNFVSRSIPKNTELLTSPHSTGMQ